MTSSSSSSSRPNAALQVEICRACFALNNMGVQLLERGHYEDATKTLQEAVSNLQVLVSTSSSRLGNQDEVEIFAAIVALKAKLQRASSRVAKRGQKQANCSSCSSSSSCCCLPLVEMSPIDDCDMDEVRDAQRYGPTTSMAFPIRFRESVNVDSFQENNNNNNGNLDWQIASVHYNYGLAQLMMYRKSGDDKQLAEAEHWLRWTNSLFPNKAAKKSSSAADEPTTDQQQVIAGMLLKSLVLSTLFTVFRFQKQMEKANKVQQVIARLQKRAVKLLEDDDATTGQQKQQLVQTTLSRLACAARAA